MSTIAATSERVTKGSQQSRRLPGQALGLWFAAGASGRVSHTKNLSTASNHGYTCRSSPKLERLLLLHRKR